jgi:hypothetical protein
MTVLSIDCRDSREKKDLLEEEFLDWDLVALYSHLDS